MIGPWFKPRSDQSPSFKELFPNRELMLLPWMLRDGGLWGQVSRTFLTWVCLWRNELKNNDFQRHVRETGDMRSLLLFGISNEDTRISRWTEITLDLKSAKISYIFRQLQILVPLLIFTIFFHPTPACSLLPTVQNTQHHSLPHIPTCDLSKEIGTVLPGQQGETIPSGPLFW